MSQRKERAFAKSPAGIRIPPHSYEAEESVLGSLIIDRDAMVSIADFLDDNDFYNDINRHIFAACKELYEKQSPIDVLSVTNRLKEKKMLNTVGGEAAIARLATLVPTAGNVFHYGRIVQKNATLRRLISAASHISDLGFNEAQEIDKTLDEAEQRLFSVSKEHRYQHFSRLSDALEEAFERIDKLHKGDKILRGISTGFPLLDKKLAGWQESDLIILAARPSLGKTTLALDFARHAALNGTTVGIFSLEMSQSQLVDRLLAAHAHVDLWKMRTGKLESEGEFDDFSRLGQAMSELSQVPIFIDDQASNNIMGIRTAARRLQAEHGLSLLIIDYLQLMESNRYTDNRVQEVSDISRSLKKLAIELNIPIIALSQLSRAVEMRGDQRPKLSDLRESGCLAAETTIVRADTGERVTIASLAKRLKQVPVPTFVLNDHLKLSVRHISKVFSSGRKRVFSMRTRTGRVIRASANHPFRTLAGWQSLEKLSVGDKIAVPRSLNITQGDNPLCKDELALLAHLIGDGCTVPHQPIHYTSADQENIKTVASCARRLYNIQARVIQQKNWYHVYLPSPYHLTHGKHNPIVTWLTDLDMGLLHSWEKIVPAKVFRCDQPSIAYFLHHLWSTDGNISWKILPHRMPAASIYYATTSERLAHDVQHLLLRLSITATIRRVPEKEHRAGFQVHIQGRNMQLKFLELVGSAGKRGLIVPRLIIALKKIKASVNYDVIPRTVWRDAVRREKERLGLSWRDVQASIGTSYCGSTLYKSAPSRERMTRLAVALRSPQLNVLAQSDVLWDEIVSIEPQGMEEVYDATVPGAHNFMANDIMVHNSLEQDADVVMFIHRQQNNQSARQYENDVQDISLLIEKHRNGPTGEIPLRFHARYVTMLPPENQLAEESALPIEQHAPV